MTGLEKGPMTEQSKKGRVKAPTNCLERQMVAMLGNWKVPEMAWSSDLLKDCLLVMVYSKVVLMASLRGSLVKELLKELEMALGMACPKEWMRVLETPWGPLADWRHLVP